MNRQPQTLNITLSGQRLDVFLSEQTGLSRSHIKNMIGDGNVTVNGETATKSGRALKVGDTVQYVIPQPKTLEAQPQNIPIEIIYQDSDLAVVNKPQGMTVHPAAGNPDKTLVNALLFHLDSLSAINGAIRPGIVHRLDKDTSGLLVVAKNDAAHRSLAAQIEKKTCKRIYIAVVDGIVKQDAGKYEGAIARSPSDRKLMALVSSGRPALTYYKVLERYNSNTLLELELATGRTHQIRVHCKYAGHPITADPAYNARKPRYALNGQLLHAAKLGFVHPRTGENMNFSAPPPSYFQEALDRLRTGESI